MTIVKNLFCWRNIQREGETAYQIQRETVYQKIEKDDEKTKELTFFPSLKSFLLSPAISVLQFCSFHVWRITSFFRNYKSHLFHCFGSATLVDLKLCRTKLNFREEADESREETRRDSENRNGRANPPAKKLANQNKIVLTGTEVLKVIFNDVVYLFYGNFLTLGFF